MYNYLQRKAAVLLAGALLLATGANAVAAVETSVDGGRVRGVAENGVVVFKGIPYATPPVGPLRWRPPQPVKAWQGVRPATSFGADCMQVPMPGDLAPLSGKPDEDCLYINVWKPRAPSSHKLPVMVWIHGGGFVNGGSSAPVFDGAAFARDGIVLVSFNYRLGNLGFFAHPALTAEQRGGPLGNYAMMDQIAALKWVQRNIVRFAGDPSNVTLFGESAGGMSVNMLLTSPLAQGLFAKAIVESGGGRPSVLPARPLSGTAESAQAKGLALAKHFGIAGEGAEALERLRSLPVADLVGGLNMATMRSDTLYVGGPIADGQLNPGAPTQLYAAGKGARVPLMIGATSLDIGFMRAQTLDDFYRQFGPQEARARTLYPGADLKTLTLEAGGDQMMVEPARAIARLFAGHGQPVYQFRFSYVAESQRKTLEGAPHFTEVPYVFDTVAAAYGKDLTAADEAMARTVHGYWVAFARTGKPEVDGSPVWPAYDATSDRLMNFTNEGPTAEPDRRKARLDLAESLNDRMSGAH